MVNEAYVNIHIIHKNKNNNPSLHGMVLEKFLTVLLMSCMPNTVNNNTKDTDTQKAEETEAVCDANELKPIAIMHA